MNPPLPEPVVVVATESDAAAMVEVVHAAFGARPPIDPPSTADQETAETIAAALRRGGGIVATVGDRPAGAILVGSTSEDVATFARVSVHPDFQRHGIASAMIAAAEDLAALQGHTRVDLFAREEFAELIAYWGHRGYAVARLAPHGVVLSKPLPTALRLVDAAATTELGRRLADVVRPGDLLVLSGELGAGKTTLTQGLGHGLGVTGPVISPTFVLSRVHATPTGRPTLVHVDAYRLGSAVELDDLDLDASAPTSVTVVEWGRGLVEQSWDDRLEVDLVHDPEGGRLALLRPVGPRWADVDLASLDPQTPAYAEASGA
ncbi:tRNA (adenosine(37)-N6)-threonylcarbamoyltransferase complex ATPase subunit type 1 TsaE [Microlunatus flavus]|uniref:tRNA threonylcarbamoyladenosine biosynthesis protein TsaE n=1 Tax=Microlunatus flavus TaxID=1036181 RepID=A0A1H9MCG9_9ACTN|nr:tRNA (adenosine(37)-N6)-threonylcarbamoyltransferase complex ATPase subunit type 1 TsaE [Microlunatus flavus]SER21322.1 tRNA threonylcarbamoyladenosine biosynthesis protein TsaE [Microlunatus flavus]